MADGDDMARVRRRMEAIPANVQAAARSALEKGAQEIVDMAKSLCPVDEGDLRNSIGWTWGSAPDGSMSIAFAKEGDMAITVYAGNDKIYYARWVEFGTRAARKGQRVADNRKGGSYRRKSYRTHSGTAAQPFFYPALTLLRKRVLARIKRESGRAIKAHWGGQS